MLSLYVQRPSVDQIVRTQTCFAYDTLGETHHVLPGVKHDLQSEVEPHQQLKKEVLQCLSNHSSFNIPEYEAGEAHLSHSLIELVHELTVLGYYSDEAMLQTELIPPVMPCLISARI